MLLVDDRVGSADLVKPFLAAGLPAEKTRLEFADVAFSGFGPVAPIDIGIELKTLGDMVGSVRSGRFAGHQLPGLRETYDRVWLMVEGTWRTNEQGQVCSYQGPRRGWNPIQGRMNGNELEKTLLTFELCGGVHVRYTNNRADTVRAIGTLYRWFTDKAFADHTSHLAVHDAPTLVAVSDFRAAVMKWPGIGMKASIAVEAHFKGSIRRAACAGVEEWAGIQTIGKDSKLRRLGHSAASNVVSFLRRGTV